MNFQQSHVIYGQILIQGWEKHVMIPEKTFSGLSVMTVADLLQQPLVRGKLIFYNFLIRILWNIRIAVMTFKYAELTEVELTNR